MKLLETVSLGKSFGGLRALNDFNFHIDDGEIVGLIGPNGAGKTTLFNLACGVYPSSCGEILFHGKSILGLRPHCIAELGIARTFQKIRLFPRLTVLRNVMVGQHCRTRSGLIGSIWRGSATVSEERMAREKAIEALSFVGLGPKADVMARNLSYGEKRLLEIARALAAEPSLLLLDEQASGLNPAEIDQLVELIDKIRKRGVSVLVIEHLMEFVMGISDRIVVMNYGMKIFDGTPEAAQADPQVIAAYLGEEMA